MARSSKQLSLTFGDFKEIHRILTERAKAVERAPRNPGKSAAAKAENREMERWQISELAKLHRLERRVREAIDALR